MKKSIIILSAFITIAGLGGFGLLNWNRSIAQNQDISCAKTSYFVNDQFSRLGPTTNSGLFYDVSSRFIMTISKSDLEKATTLADFQPNEPIIPLVSYYSMTVTLLNDDLEDEANANGTSDILNDEQLKLIRGLNYSMNIRITAEYRQMNHVSGKMESSYCTPHLTIVPEREAEYLNGKEALLKYVTENTKDFASQLRQDMLRPGMIEFTVTTEGKLADIVLTSSSGFTDYDHRVFELVSNMPGSWMPATNANGQTVEQKLIFFFGTMGC